MISTFVIWLVPVGIGVTMFVLFADELAARRIRKGKRK